MSIRSLGKHSIIYGLSHVASRGITFLLLPIYTNIFSPNDYGIISLIYTFIGFMNVILHYGLDASIIKYYIPANQNKRRSILTNGYISFLITTCLFVIILILVGDKFSNILFGTKISQFVNMVSYIIFFDVLWSIHVLILRAENKSITFTAISFFNVISTFGFNIYFLFVLKLGIYGVLLSNLIVSAFIFVITFPIIYNRISLSTLSLLIWKKLMHFGLPLFPAGIFSMILELSDRYILHFLKDTETVGIYSAGYKIGMLMLLVVMGFNMAWQPYFLKKDIKERRYINNVTIITISILFYLWILILLWSNNLIMIQFWNKTLFGPEYWDAIKIVPIISLSYIFHAIYLLQLPGVYLLEKSNIIAWVRFGGAILNIILNFIFIPKYGIMGAASSTCIAFVMMGISFYFINKKIFPIIYNWKKLLVIFFVSFIIYLIKIYLEPELHLKMILSIVYPIIMLIFGIVNYNKVNIFKLK